MKRLLLSAAVLVLAAGLDGCNNPASDSGKDTSDLHESMSSARDTMLTNKSGFTLAQQQMMNDMHQMPLTGNVDKDYAMMIKSYHQGAIDMAQHEITSGKDADLKEMAGEIINELKAEIPELESIFASLDKAPDNYDPKKKDEGFGKVLDENMRMMMDMAKMDTGMTPDHQFVAMMIPHHQSSVFIAQEFLKYGKDARLMALAKRISAIQQKELDEFQNWMDREKK